MTRMRWAVATVLGVLLLPAAAEASPVLRVKDGRARFVNDRLLPPKARTALPAVPSGTTVATPLAGRAPRSSRRRSARATTPRWLTRDACATAWPARVTPSSAV
jgi:hypothetical protein